jgi:hypothetical protein
MAIVSWSPQSQRSAQYPAGEALRMDSHQRRAFCQIAKYDRERGFDPLRAVRNIALVPDDLEQSPSGRHAGGCDAPERSSLRRSHRFVLVPFCVLA